MYEDANPHMKGTIDILSDLFSGYKFDKKEVLKHFAMTNGAQIFLFPDAELPKSSNISLFRVGNDEIRICSTG